MDFVAIDLGASNTRYLSTGGQIKFLPNNMVFISNMSENLHNEHSDGTFEENLDVSIWKTEESKYFPVRVLVGDMADRFGQSQQRPSNIGNKTSQKINYVSAILAVAMSKICNKSIGNSINMFIALPPVEAVERRDIIKQGLVGNYIVTFNKLGGNGTTVQFAINDVACYEESRMALMQYIFDDNYKDRLEKFIDANVLSIDIGASTTDLVLFRRGKFLDKTGRTYKIGCNLAIDYIVREVLKKFGFEPSFEEAERALIEGRIRVGNKARAIEDIVGAAKREVAQAIFNNMNAYFGSIGMALQSVQYIIVSGGGSMESGYTDENGIRHETSRPMSVYITDELKNLSDDSIEVIHFGEEPRLANIKGLGKLAIIKKGEINN